MILEKGRLLHGPYRPSRLYVGDRTDCLMRGTFVITSWTDTRISWQHWREHEVKSHHGLLLYNGLGRAVRREAAMSWRHRDIAGLSRE
jgi:hypothetical protein